MRIIDIALLLAFGAFIVAFLATTIIDFLRKKKNKKKNLKKGENDDGNYSN